MKYLSDSERQDLHDFAHIANNLLGGGVSATLLKLKVAFGTVGKDDCTWFLQQVSRLKDKEAEAKEHEKAQALYDTEPNGHH